MGGVVKRHAQQQQEEHEVEEDDDYNAHAGLDFFQKFQSLFGWGDDTTTTTSPLPRPAQPVLAKVPSHRHQQAVQEIPTPTVAPVQYPPPPHSQYPRRPQATIGQYYNYPQNVRYPPPPQYPYRYPSPYQVRPYYHPYPQTQAQYPQTTPVISTNPPTLQHTTPTNLPKAETQVEKEALGEVVFPNKNKAIPNKNNAIPNKSKAIPNKKLLRNPVHQPIVLSESALPESVLPPEDCHTRDGDIGVC